MTILKDKYVIIVGDHDSVPEPAIGECTKTAGVRIACSPTECLVRTSADAMDLEDRKRVLSISGEHDLENIIALLGAAEAKAAGLTAEIVTADDPTYAGPLAGVQLGLSAYHIYEDEVKAETDPAAYGKQVGVVEMVMDVSVIHEEMEDIRKEYYRY